MSTVSRRVFFVTAGAAAALSSLPPFNRASAYFWQQDGESLKAFTRRCTEAGGEVEEDEDEDEYDCINTPADRDCEASYRKGAFYSENEGKCLNTGVTTEADRACETSHGEGYYYSEKNGECTEIKCFLTTACVTTAGLADDCFELAALRRFRDEVLLHQPDGPALVDLYYRTAPSIVTRMSAMPDSRRAFARLYVLYILPCALAAQFGCNGLTRRLYTRMMADLSARYGVPLTT